MKSNDLRKKSLSDFSSQDELSKGRLISVEKAKRSKKPSIYDELDEEEDDFYASAADEDDLIEDDDSDDEDEDDRY